MNYKELFKGDYLAAIEFGERVPTFTIVGVKIVRLERIDKPGKERDRGVLFFKETDRGLVLNRTNAQCIAGMFGVETDAWIGKRVTLYATPVKVGPKVEPGIRVKGSPDLTAPVDAKVSLPHKAPVVMRMEKTS